MIDRRHLLMFATKVDKKTTFGEGAFSLQWFLVSIRILSGLFRSTKLPIVLYAKNLIISSFHAKAFYPIPPEGFTSHPLENFP